MGRGCLGGVWGEVLANQPDGWHGLSPAPLPAYLEAGVACGDYDRDGLPDLLVSGFSVSKGATALDVYENTYQAGIPGAVFQEIDAGLPGVLGGRLALRLALGDLNQDSALDLVVVGMDDTRAGVTAAYLNQTTILSPVSPIAPRNLRESVQEGAVLLSWDRLEGSITYNVSVGTTPGAVDVVSPMSDPETGRRLLPALGNAGTRPNLRLTGLKPGQYYWGVQTVDAGFVGSSFSPLRQFTVPVQTGGIRLSASFSPGSGQHTITLSGVSGRTVILQESADLKNWQDFGETLTTDQSVVIPRDQDSGVFFRARVKP